MESAIGKSDAIVQAAKNRAFSSLQIAKMMPAIGQSSNGSSSLRRIPR
jgi:hypothetical protein